MATSPRILDAIQSPADLKVLSDEELKILADEIRREIVETTSVTGGHVASSLGAVEIILAVHSIIDAPRDKFIFDVGHQSYAHKLVTGRLDSFETLRQWGGIAGFPRPSESAFDVHASGHASDSLSIAFGEALARDLRGSDEKIVALIGDASIAGGMAFEALNSIGQSGTPMLIILNDNEMSISRNVGALVKHFGTIRTSASYQTSRDDIQERLEQSGALGQFIVDWGRSAKESVKQFILPHMMIFEHLGIICTPPIDGHDITALRQIIEQSLKADAPVLMHVVTKKGAGYGPAESDPERFHGIGPYDIETGESKPKPDAKMSFTQAFGQALVKEARADEDIVAITAAMQGGTGLTDFANEFPERFLDAGIAEGHAVGTAAGLALGGKKPVVAIYSTFLQRAIDQMVIDCALCDCDIVFAIDRAGIVGEDGPTHQGAYDLVYTRMIPGMRVLAPSDEAELTNALHTALALGGPFALRYPRGEGLGVEIPEEPEVWTAGESRTLREGDDLAILAFGREVQEALAAADLLEQKDVAARVVDMRWVKPVDVEAVREAAKTGLIVTVEDGVIAGGAGAAVLECLACEGLSPKTLVLGIPDEPVPGGAPAIVRASLGLDAEGIANAILDRLG